MLPAALGPIEMADQKKGLRVVSYSNQVRIVPRRGKTVAVPGGLLRRLFGPSAGLPGFHFSKLVCTTVFAVHTESPS